MTEYAPQPERWHNDLPGACDCEPAWKDRGLVDDRCYWHRLIEAVMELRDNGWFVDLPASLP